MKILTLLASFSLLFVLAHCGGDSSGNPPTCNGSSCSCPANTTCDLTGSTCEDKSCSLKCADKASCNGACGESCSADCTGGSTCALTVGKSGSVTCSGNSICHITCTGECSVSCGGGATCDLTCAGEAMSKSISEGGKCAM